MSVQRAFNELFKSDFTPMDFSGWNMDLLQVILLVSTSSQSICSDFKKFN